MQKAADAAVASEASGIASASIGAIKGMRSAFRVGGAARKYKQVKSLGDPHLVHAGSLARLNESREQANWPQRRPTSRWTPTGGMRARVGWSSSPRPSTPLGRRWVKPVTPPRASSAPRRTWRC